ncbi:fatty acyl-CoA reductase wat-like isoform X2 [Drosophila serrata]|uniref:fatty acyl-CoA reductase wat-like isoform X2 n=1 Tax=Drosophila serrata TaxID=7274 RepID=UPI000A1D2CC8|nr:fatty acyl-CoA reductase wat-like isoform X2 [Drosophila serrata]
MECGIQDFYKDKVVFLTGATGFLGKVIIAKLLRATDVKRIYAMARPKRNLDIQARFQAWQEDPLFEVLLKSKPLALQRVSTIAGDCIEHDLGISIKDRQLLASEVQIFIHGAATVRFNEPLSVALSINTRATKLMLQLAKEMKHLEAFLHISTAFSNCVIQNIKEKFYPDHLDYSSEQILQISNLALAEDVILREAGTLPLCIFRPSIIIAAHKEPQIGWIDNLYGPMAILFGVAKGVLRIATIDVKTDVSLVPVDYCANLALACAWQTTKDERKEKEAPTIYQLAPSEGNKITNGEFINHALDGRMRFPLTKMIWYPFLHCITTMWLYPLAAFFYHTLPAYFFDLALWLQGRKPRLVKIYQKVHRTLMILGPFSCRSWEFETNNTDRLRNQLSAEDRKLYYFDMASLDWTEYFQSALGGMRVFLGKEPLTPESVAKGLKLIKRLKLFHHILQYGLCSVAAIALWFLLKLVV